MTIIPTAATAEDVPEGIEVFLPAVYDIVWSLVPFAIIILFFWLWGVPRFRKILDERRAAIEGGIEKADAAQAEAAEVLAEYNRQLAEARTEAAQIREQARKDGADILAELRARAQNDADRITSQAHEQIEAERESALRSLRQEVGTLALDLAGNVIGETLADDKKAAAVVDRFIADLEADQKAKA